MSVTRLLVLGAVRLFQPAHGYLVRRELMSWHADDWAHLNPGSVYNALRSLTKEGLLDERTPSDGAAAGPPARTAYALTPDGEDEFLALVREALWQPHPFEPGWLFAGISFWAALSRVEVIQALGALRASAAGQIPLLGHQADAIVDSRGTPDHVAEMMRLSAARAQAQVAWIDDAVRRLEAGAYWFAGEPEVDPTTGLRRDGMDLTAFR